MAGINGLERQSDSEFEIQYRVLVDSLREASPYSKIYLQSILPVNNNDFKKSYCNNEKIIRANNIIKRIATDRIECEYVDLWSKYQINNAMPQELTKDGIHLKPEAYSK